MELTPREIEIVLMMAEGFTSDEIAAKLFVSPLTVNNHRKAIFRKSGYRTWNQFMVQVATNGLLDQWTALFNQNQDGTNGVTRTAEGQTRPP